jgi:gliding motility-associated-like protein
LFRKLRLLSVLILAAVYCGYAQAPVANISATPMSGCPPLAVSFVDNSSNNPTTHNWTFPGGLPASSTASSIAVTFNTPGLYTVQLTSSNASGSSTTTQVITVNPVPTANFTQDKTTGCYPTWVNFTDQSTPNGAPITSYLWNFGDGTQDVVQNPSHRYTIGGPLQVTLYVKNAFGCTGTAQVKNVPKAIILTGGIFPNFNSILNSSCTLPVTASFSNTTVTTGGIAAPTWNWDFGDGGGFSNTTFSPLHNYNTAGTYSVRLAATSTSGCSDTLALPVNITSNGNQTDFTAPAAACINTSVSFTNSSSPPPVSSTWDFGDGSALGTNINEQHTYTTPGIKHVVLTNTFGGCSGTVTKDINIVLPPTTAFTGTNLNSCAPPLTASFTNNSIGATSFLWDFGNGNTSTLQNPPPQTYTTYGNFTVTLTSSSATGCSTILPKAAFVNVQKPTVSINSVPAFGCAPYIFTPTASVSAVDGVASYSWNFGNGNTSNSATPPAQIYAAGTYTITLTITTTGGCTATATGTVQVGSIKPVPAFSFVPPTGCVNTPIHFTDASPGANKWFWEFGDGNVDNTNTPTPTYAYLKPGTYSVRLTAYNNGCWDSISHPITINGPLADFKFAGTCGKHNSFTFTDNSTGPVTSWLWDFKDGGPTSNLPNPPVHIFPAGPPTIYNVTLTVTNSATGCSNTISYPVQANQGPIDQPSSNPVCANTQIYFTKLPAGGNYTYVFEFGDGNSSLPANSASVGYFYPNAGSYPAKVITTDLTTGCVDSSAVVTVVVNGATVNFVEPPPLTCNALTYTFKDLSTVPAGSSIASRIWDFGDGTTSTVTPATHTYSSPGTFMPKLTVTDNHGCVASLSGPTAVIVSIPVASFGVIDTFSCPNGNPIHFFNTSVGGFNPTYQWDFGDGATSTANSPLYAYTAVGNYPVKLTMTDMYGCVSLFTFPVKITVDTPNASFTMSGNYSACPPFNDTFRFTGHYPQKYAWLFGDGNGSVIQNPSNLFANPGDYDPQLTVTSPGGCTTQYSLHVHVDGPIGNFSYSPLAGCDSLDVNFIVTGSNATSFDWVFGDGTPKTTTLVPSNSHHYSAPNQYTPIVYLKDAAGCIIPKIGTQFINVDGITKPLFTTDKSTVCDTGTVNFTDATVLADKYTIITNYTWDFGDGTAPVSGMNPTIPHKYTVVGNYNAVLSISTAGGCSGTYSLPIVVAASPQISFNGLLNQCEPAVLTYSGNQLVADPYGPLSWSWVFGNGQSATVQNPAPVNYPKAGEYVVYAAATNTKGCRTVTDTAGPATHLFIYPIPAVNAGADTTICQGNTTLQLNATGQATSYTWDPPINGSTLTCQVCSNPVANAPVSTYFVVLGTSPQGCAARDTIQVTVNTPPVVSVSGPDSVCLGQSTPLSATGAAIYQWTPTEGLSNPGIANPVATPDASQLGGASSAIINYQVTGYDSKKCFSDTKSVNITAFNYPAITLAPNATINVGSSYQINAAVTTNIVSLNWTPPNNLSCTNCLTPVATPISTTKYSLTAINDGGCATTDSIRVQVICNGANFFVPNSFSPNGDGVNDHFIVNGIGLNVIPSITIYNRWGQIVFQKSNFPPNSAAAAWDGTFNGQPAPPDVYIYTIQILCDNATLIPYHGNVTLIR